MSQVKSQQTSHVLERVLITQTKLLHSNLDEIDWKVNTAFGLEYWQFEGARKQLSKISDKIDQHCTLLVQHFNDLSDRGADTISISLESAVARIKQIRNTIKQRDFCTKIKQAINMILNGLSNLLQNTINAIKTIFH